MTEYTYDNLNRLVEELWVDVPAPEPSLSISTTTQGNTTDEVQRVGITVSGMGFIGGTFTLTYSGQTTSAIAYNASAATVQAALEALSNIGVGDVSVTKFTDTPTGQVWEVTFTGALADTDVTQITIDSTNVTAMGMKMNVQQTIVAGGAITYEVQTTTMLNTNGGTYTLSFEGQTTSALAWDASAATLDSALEALSTIDTVNVSGSSGCFSISFTGTHTGENVPQLSGDDSNLENHQNRALSFTYDAADQLTAAEDPAAEYAYTYDGLGRVTQQTQDLAGLTPTIVFAQAFDAASNRTELAATIGANADFKNTYTYDNLNRMTRVTQEGVMMGNAVASKRIDLTYNAASQFDVISRYQSTDTSAPVAATALGYDGMGRLTSLDHTTNSGATTLAAYDYTFDAASRITSVTSSIDGLSSFTYDVTDQLTAADHASQPDETYSFDLNGNRTMTGHTVGSNNRLLSDGTYNYTYDNEGNRITRTDISTSAVTEYEWDHRNRLTKVTEKNSSGTVVETTENTYDLFDHWIRRSYDADGAGSGTAVDTFFAYDGNQIALQFDGTQDSDLSHRYLWGPDVDQFFSDEQVTSLASEGNVLWGLGDHQGSLRDIADRNEGTGVTTVTNHREYHGFGALTGETNSAVDLIFGFTGRLFDETTGLQDNWHRPYDSRTGNWPSEDPIQFEGDPSNLNRYVLNNPLNRVDPSGLVPPDQNGPYDPFGIGQGDVFGGGRAGAGVKLPRGTAKDFSDGIGALGRTPRAGDGLMAGQQGGRGYKYAAEVQAATAFAVAALLEEVTIELATFGVGCKFKVVVHYAPYFLRWFYRARIFVKWGDEAIEVSQDVIRSYQEAERRAGRPPLTLEEIAKKSAAQLKIFQERLKLWKGKAIAQSALKSKSEIETALELERLSGKKLYESLDVCADFIDDAGRTYDAVGGSGAQRQGIASFLRSLDWHFLKSGADFIVMDLRYLSPTEIKQVIAFIDNLPQEAKERIIKIGF